MDQKTTATAAKGELSRRACERRVRRRARKGSLSAGSVQRGDHALPDHATHHRSRTYHGVCNPPNCVQVGILWNISQSAETTAGEFTMMDQTMPQGTGAPPYVHERYDEGFFIIDGTVEYTIGYENGPRTILAEHGAAVWIPLAPATPSRSGPRQRALSTSTPRAASTKASPCSPPQHRQDAPVPRERRQRPPRLPHRPR